MMRLLLAQIKKVSLLLVAVPIVLMLFSLIAPNRAISDIIVKNTTISPISATAATTTNTTVTVGISNSTSLSSPSPTTNSTMTNSTSFTACCTPILLAPIATTTGNNVYVVWPSNKTGHFEILFRASSDNGKTFSDKVKLNNNNNSTQHVNSFDPQIAASSNNHVYVSWWQDYGNGTRIPFFRASDDGGHTFGPILSLPDNGPIPTQHNTNQNTTEGSNS